MNEVGQNAPVPVYSSCPGGPGVQPQGRMGIRGARAKAMKSVLCRSAVRRECFGQKSGPLCGINGKQDIEFVQCLEAMNGEYNCGKVYPNEEACDR